MKNAQFKFYVLDSSGAGEIHIYAVDKSWVEAEIKFQLVTSKENLIATVKTNPSVGFHSVDLTSYIKNIVSNELPNNGFYLTFNKYLAIDEFGSENNDTTRTASYDCDTIKEWEVSNIAAGDLTYYHTKVYKCKEGPTSVWCGAAGYEPDGVNGHVPWDSIGDCYPRQAYIYASEVSDKSKRPALEIDYDGVVAIDMNSRFNQKETILLSNRQLTIYSNQILPLQLTLYSVMGKEILSINKSLLSKGLTSISLKTLSSGYYIANIRLGTKQIKFTLLVQE